MFGPFRSTGVIGRGGMGEVHGAQHEPSGTPAAVKRILGTAAREARFRAAFRNEVRAVAGLSHPGVVRLYDFGLSDATSGSDDDEAPWLAMERLDGALHRDAVLTWPVLRETLASVLEALSHAHARGVVHRDLKPENVMWGRGPRRPVLVDFGLAQAWDAAETEDERVAGLRNAVVGTPAYMAPEQTRGDAREQGPWTDLYAVGCIGWELSTGAPPFMRASPFATMLAHVMEPLPAFLLRFAVPPRFEAWLRRMLGRTPASRFQRATDARFALGLVGAEAPVETTFMPAVAESPQSVTIETPYSGDVATDPTMDLSDGARDRVSHPLESLSTADASNPFPPAPLLESLDTPDEPSASILPGVGLSLFGLRTLPMIGRRSARTLGWTLLSRVVSEQRPRALVIRGGTGIGKSRLAGWLVEQAEEHASILSLRAHAAPDAPPEEAVQSMLCRFFRAFDLPRARVPARIAAEFDRLGVADPSLVDYLAAMVSPAPEGPSVFAHVNEARDVLLRFVGVLSKVRPVLVWLDDVHTSRHALAFVTALLEAADESRVPVLVVCTVNDEGASDATRRRLDQLTAMRGVTVLPLLPLDAEESGALVRSLLGMNPGLARRVEAHAAGNPLYLVQLVSEWVRAGVLESTAQGVQLRPGLDALSVPLPDSLVELWHDRVLRFLEARPTAEVRAVWVAAALGQQVDEREWAAARAAISGADPRSLPGLVDALSRANLVRIPTDGPAGAFHFSHGTLRAAVCGHAERNGALASVNAACAQGLATLGAEEDAARLALHWVAAGAPASALEPYRVAVRRALDAGDFDEASQLLDARDVALAAAGCGPEDEPTGESVLLRARLATTRGETSTAERLAVEAESGARRFGWRWVLAQALIIQGNIAAQAGRGTSALSILEDAVGCAREAGDLRAEGRALEFAGEALARQGRFDDAALKFEAARGAYRGVGDPIGEGRALLGTARAEKQGGHLDVAADANRRALACFESVGARTGIANCQNNLGELARLRGELAAAERHYRVALEAWTARGSPNVAYAWANLGLVLIEAGRELEALDHMKDVVSRFARLKHATPEAIAWACLMPCFVAAGDLAAFDDAFERVRAHVTRANLVDRDTARMAERAAEALRARGETTRAEDVEAFARAQRLALQQSPRSGH